MVRTDETEMSLSFVALAIATKLR